MRQHPLYNLILFGLTALTALVIVENMAISWPDIAGLALYVLVGSVIIIQTGSLLQQGLLDDHLPANRILQIATVLLFQVMITAFLGFVTGWLDNISLFLPVLHFILVLGATLGKLYYGRTLRILFYKNNRILRQCSYFTLDILVLTLAPFAALFIRYDFALAWGKAIATQGFAATTFLVAIPCLLGYGIHRIFWRYHSLPDILRLVAAVTTTISLTMIISFHLDRLESIPRSLPLIQWAFSLTVMMGIRLLVPLVFPVTDKPDQQSSPDTREYVLVVGLNHVTQLYLNSTRILGHNRIRVIGLLDEAPSRKGRFFCNKKVVGSPADLQDLLASYMVHGIKIKRIVITVPFNKLSRHSRDILLRWKQSDTVTLDLFEEKLGFGGGQQQEQARKTTGTRYNQLDDCNIAVANVRYFLAKRLFDLVGAITLIILLSPLVVITALLVLIDLGLPFIFWQERPGLYGIPFRLYKFRTMRSKGDRQLKYGNREENNLVDKQRITKIGNFLRRTRLDELPQLYHILVGEMSFVGPRPLLPAYQPENGKIRLSVRPGVTGWAQVHGGDCLSAEEKLALDVQYLKDISFKKDIQTLIMTLKVAVKGDKVDDKAINDASEELTVIRQKIAKGQSLTQTGDSIKSSGSQDNSLFGEKAA